MSLSDSKHNFQNANTQKLKRPSSVIFKHNSNLITYIFKNCQIVTPPLVVAEVMYNVNFNISEVDNSFITAETLNFLN